MKQTIMTWEHPNGWTILQWLKPSEDLSLLWADVQAAGWKFCYFDGEAVVMTKNGYINRFKNVGAPLNQEVN